jgi:hypothetical protein
MFLSALQLHHARQKVFFKQQKSPIQQAPYTNENTEVLGVVQIQYLDKSNRKWQSTFGLITWYSAVSLAAIRSKPKHTLVCLSTSQTTLGTNYSPVFFINSVPYLYS